MSNTEKIKKNVANINNDMKSIKDKISKLKKKLASKKADLIRVQNSCTHQYTYDGEFEYTPETTEFNPSYMVYDPVSARIDATIYATCSVCGYKKVSSKIAIKVDYPDKSSKRILDTLINKYKLDEDDVNIAYDDFNEFIKDFNLEKAYRIKEE